MPRGRIAAHVLKGKWCHYKLHVRGVLAGIFRSTPPSRPNNIIAG